MLMEKFIEADGILKFAEETESEYRLDGVLTTFKNTDQVGDVIYPDAFDEWLSSGKAAQVPMYWQHNRSEILGDWKNVRKSGANRVVGDGRMIRGVAKVSDAHLLIKAESVKGISVGLRILKYAYARERCDKYSYPIDILKAEIREASIVAEPANLKAGITRMKHMDGSVFTEAERADLVFKSQLNTIIANKSKISTKLRKELGIHDG